MPKKSLQQRLKAGGTTERQAIKQALAKPGWRRYLSKSQLATAPAGKAITQRRALNERLNTAITPGSTTTERDLAREAHANLGVEYGPQEADLRNRLGVSQQRERDIGGFYDQYLAELQHGQQNVAQAGQTAAAGLAATQAGITGLSAANLTQLQNPAVQDAQARGATAGDLSQMASNAAATRQALMGSFQAQQALQAGAANRYAGGLAHVVGPGQKLQAQAEYAGKTEDVRKLQSDLATRRAQADVKYRSERRGEEAKTVLANKIANVNTDLKAATLAETTRSHKAGESLTATKIAADATQKKATADAKVAADAKKAHEPNKYGVPADQWATWSTSHRQRVMDSKGGKAGKGGKPAETSGAWTGQLTTAREYAQRAKEGRKFNEPAGQEGRKDPAGAISDRHQAAVKVLQAYGDKIKDPVIASAGADAVYLGFLSQNSINQFQKIGISAKQEAEILGVPTWREYQKKHGGSGTGGYSKGGSRPD